MSTEIRQLTKEGTPFYPQTHVEALVGNNGSGVDEEPTAGSENLVKSAGINSRILVSTNVFEDASSIVGDWTCPKPSVSFTAATGKNNGTFTAVTGGTLPANAKPYFDVANLENGKRYRLKFRGTVNSSVRNFIALAYLAEYAGSWSSLIDEDGNRARVNSGNLLDIVFVADTAKKYICITLDSLNQNDTIVIEDFSIEKATSCSEYFDNYETKDASKEKYDDSKTNLGKISFDGADNTYKERKYSNVLLKNHKYRITFNNIDWVYGEAAGSTFLLKLFTYKNEAEVQRLVVVYANDSEGVKSQYTFTCSSDCDYFVFGGRANIGQKAEAVLEDITEVTAINKNITEIYRNVALNSKINWPLIYGKSNAGYSGRINASGVESSSGKYYALIFQVFDYIFLQADISDNYHIVTGIHDTFEDALTNPGVRGHYFGNITNAAAYSQYRFGDSTVKEGFLLVSIKRKDNENLSDADVTTILSDLNLIFYQKDYIETRNKTEDNVRYLNGDSYNGNTFSYYVCDSNGKMVDSPVRFKFIRDNYKANSRCTITVGDISSIPTLVWGISIYRSFYDAQQNASAGRREILLPSWATPESVFIGNELGGVLNIFFKKSDNSPFTYTEIETIKSAFNIAVDDSIQEDTNSQDSKLEILPLGSFVNGSGNGAILSESTTVVSTPYILVLPHMGVTMMAKLPAGYMAKVVTGTNQNLGTANTWKENMEEFVIPSGHQIYRLQFKKSDDSTLTAEQIKSLVDAGTISVIYKKVDEDVVKRNFDNERYIKAACLRLGLNADERKYQGFDLMPVFVHTSDLHGDATRLENCVKYAKMLNADAMLVTGDSVLYTSDNNSLYQKDIIGKHSGIPYITCIGNHEVYAVESGSQVLVTPTQIMERFISPYIEQGSYKKDAQNVADNAYYYVDLDSKKIRIIVLNQYDNGCYWGENTGGRLGQTQITWLCNTLLSTPQDYGVIIAMHSNECKINTPQEMTAWNQTVNWDGRDEDTYGYCVNGLYANSIRPVRTIVDAFISKTSLNTTYDENNRTGNNGETVTINVDFSQVATGVEFICYLTGHRHKDNIGYVDGATNMQLELNIICGNPYYERDNNLSFSSGSDLPRGDRGVTQDAFNVYAIDRQNGRVKIARVGSNVNFEGVERKFLIAPYRD